MYQTLRGRCERLARNPARVPAVDTPNGRGTCSQNKRFVQPAIDHCESVLFKNKDAACEAEYHALVPETLISKNIVLT
jgi:hypothetical protein